MDFILHVSVAITVVSTIYFPITFQLRFLLYSRYTHALRGYPENQTLLIRTWLGIVLTPYCLVCVAISFAGTPPLLSEGFPPN